MSEKTIIVGGCFGYLGNALCQRLLLKGYKVIGIDNGLRKKMVRSQESYSATRQPSMEEHEKLFFDLGDFHFYNFDISMDYNNIKKLIQKFNPSTIVNLAHQPSGPYSQINNTTSTLSLMNNILGTNNIL